MANKVTFSATKVGSNTRIVFRDARTGRFVDFKNTEDYPRVIQKYFLKK